MTLATLRDEFTEAMVSFAWSQWTQMGLSGAAPAAIERRAADPEALVMFSLAVGRHDPLLFDELLDWLAHNRGLLSEWRLSRLGVEPVDARLVAAALPTGRRAQPSSGALEPLFANTRAPIEADPAFAAAGFQRPVFVGSGKSQSPELEAPINLAFRLRQIFGRGARAEVIRLLLTIDAPRVGVGVLNEGAGVSDRNVRSALAQLTGAGAARETVVGGGRSYRMDRAEWPQARGPGGPVHYDWIQALGAAGDVLRWLHEPTRLTATDYVLASEARQLIMAIEPRLRFAGIPVEGQSARGADYWEAFVQTTGALSGALGGGG